MHSLAPYDAPVWLQPAPDQHLGDSTDDPVGIAKGLRNVSETDAMAASKGSCVGLPFAIEDRASASAARPRTTKPVTRPAIMRTCLDKADELPWRDVRKCLSEPVAYGMGPFVSDDTKLVGTFVPHADCHPCRMRLERRYSLGEGTNTEGVPHVLDTKSMELIIRQLSRSWSGAGIHAPHVHPSDSPEIIWQLGVLSFISSKGDRQRCARWGI